MFVSFLLLCLRKNNFLEKYYRSAPIGITVEGSNTLTRSLIIFGQGLNKSHPHIFPLLESIMNDDLDKFKTAFNKIVCHSISLYAKTFSFSKGLEQQIIDFAALTNFIALRGGAIKREQMLSGDMADIFSNLYLALAVHYYHQQNEASAMLTSHIVQRLVYENQVTMNRIIDNVGFEYIFLRHLKRNICGITYDDERTIFNETMNNPNIIAEIKKNIHVDNNVLEELERINTLEPSSDEHRILAEKIIGVAEYAN